MQALKKADETHSSFIHSVSDSAESGADHNFNEHSQNQLEH